MAGREGGHGVDGMSEGTEARRSEGVTFLVELCRPGEPFLGAILVPADPEKLWGGLKGREGVKDLEFYVGLRV